MEKMRRYWEVEPSERGAQRDPRSMGSDWAGTSMKLGEPGAETALDALISPSASLPEV
jgi:hypothetical protein